MRIKNNPKIFYLACGLLAEGDRRYDSDDAEIAALAEKIQKAAPEASLDAEILQWFNLAKTGQVEKNPYWPRGHAMMMATLFLNGKELDIDHFVEFMETVNMQDPIGEEEFRQWLGRLPEVLAYTENVFRGLWKEYCKIMFVRTNSWMPEIEASRKPLKEFFGRGNIPNLVMLPNLFAGPFAADFVRQGDDIIMIACKPDIERILQEALRDIIAKYEEKIAAFYEERDDDEPVTQECFVHALSTILAGGGEGRVQAHVNCGFANLPAIIKYFEKHRPDADNLGDFIDIVLKGMVETNEKDC